MIIMRPFYHSSHMPSPSGECYVSLLSAFFAKVVGEMA